MGFALNNQYHNSCKALLLFFTIFFLQYYCALLSKVLGTLRQFFQALNTSSKSHTYIRSLKQFSEISNNSHKFLKLSLSSCNHWILLKSLKQCSEVSDISWKSWKFLASLKQFWKSKIVIDISRHFQESSNVLRFEAVFRIFKQFFEISNSPQNFQLFTEVFNSFQKS